MIHFKMSGSKRTRESAFPVDSMLENDYPRKRYKGSFSVNDLVRLASLMSLLSTLNQCQELSQPQIQQNEPSARTRFANRRTIQPDPKCATLDEFVEYLDKKVEITYSGKLTVILDFLNILGKIVGLNMTCQNVENCVWFILDNIRSSYPGIKPNVIFVAKHIRGIGYDLCFDLIARNAFEWLEQNGMDWDITVRFLTGYCEKSYDDIAVLVSAFTFGDSAVVWSGDKYRDHFARGKSVYTTKFDYFECDVRNRNVRNRVRSCIGVDPMAVEFSKRYINDVNGFLTLEQPRVVCIQ